MFRPSNMLIGDEHQTKYVLCDSKDLEGLHIRQRENILLGLLANFLQILVLLADPPHEVVTDDT